MISSFSDNQNINVIELNGNINIKIKENEHCLHEWLSKINELINK